VIALVNDETGASMKTDRERNLIVNRRRLSVAGLLLVTVYLCAQATSGVPQFSSDLVVSSKEAAGGAKSKIYSNGQKLRLDAGEIPDGSSMIQDLASRATYVLMPSRKQYIEETDRAVLIAPVTPLSAENPCANEKGVTCTKVGIETVQGRLCTKWVYAGSDDIQMLWLDQKLHLPIRTTHADGTTVSLENLQEGPQDPNLFVIPQDYQKFDASSAIGSFGFLSYSLFLFGPLSLILRVICVVHWIRRRPNTFWLWIIIVGGTLGCLAYVAIEIIPDATLLRRSFAFVGRNKRIHQLTALVQDNPAPGNYEELGDLYLDARKYAEARAAFDRAITSRTDHASPFYGRALAGIELKDYAAAEPDLERAVAIDRQHDFQRAAGLLAYVYFKNGKNAEAGKLFAEVTQTSTISETLYHYAEYLAAQGKAAEARAALQRVLDKKATLPVFLKRRERPWFRKASSLLKTIPQAAS
jgi:hypothetical protein